MGFPMVYRDGRKRKLRQGSLKKKAGSLLLAAAMLGTSFPAFSMEAYAADLPDSTQFAAVDDLKAFDTDDTNGTNPAAKVYFGNDPNTGSEHQWWIAGSQKGNLTLLAASPLATGQMFEPDDTNDKAYSEAWGCDYTSTGGSNPTDVFPHHYGASPLRATLKNLEASYFSGVEQSLINDTIVYTNDRKNGSVYATKERLYLAYGEGQEVYITVGANSPDSLNNALRVDISYWGNSGFFWLRAPSELNNNYALIASPVTHANVNYSNVNNNRVAVAPAFELDLSSVIFASAAPAASSEGALALQDVDGNGAFTLRYNANNLGSALVSYDKRKVTLTDVPAGTYLIVQNSAGAYAKSVRGGSVITPQQVDPTLTSFENCKVWLETTDTTNRITYAALATEAQGYSVTITENTGLKIASGNAMQEVAPNTVIDAIAVEVAEDYYLPDDYINKITGLNGLTVTRTGNGLTISGTPTGDVALTLPPATAAAYTIAASPASLDFGALNEGYKSNPSAQSVTITNTGSSKATLENPTSLNYNITLSGTEIDPGGTAALAIVPKAGLIAGTYNETLEIKTTKGTSASVDVTFKVNGALSVSLSTSAKTITEGESVTLTAAVQGGSGSYSYTWYANDVEDPALQGNEVTAAPTVTTTYKVVVEDTIKGKSAAATVTVLPKGYAWEAPGDFIFGDRHIGYEDVPANSFTIKNTGSVEVTNLNVALTGADASAFALDTAGMQTTLSPGGATVFTVKPNTGLAAGTYEAEVQITDGFGVTKTAGIRFTVGDHTFQWVVDQEATETEKGSKHEECTICGYKKPSVEIPATGLTDPERPGTDKPDINKPDSNKGSVQTGDRTGLLLWEVLLIGSGGILLYGLYRKKRKMG